MKGNSSRALLGTAAPRPASYLDAAFCEADLSLASLWNGGCRFPPGQEPGRGREEPAMRRRISPGTEVALDALYGRLAPKPGDTFI